MSASTPDPAAAPPLTFAALTVAEAHAHRRYWRFNLILIAVLCVIGGAVSFVLPMCAPSLAKVYFLGWPLPYYMGAQGAILIYTLLICVYVLLMQKADRSLQQALLRTREAAGRLVGEPRA